MDATEWWPFKFATPSLILGVDNEGDRTWSKVWFEPIWLGNGRIEEDKRRDWDPFGLDEWINWVDTVQ